MPEEIRKYKNQLDGRAMLVRKAQVVPLEAIVRGYLVGAFFFSFSLWLYSNLITNLRFCMV